MRLAKIVWNIDALAKFLNNSLIFGKNTWTFISHRKRKMSRYEKFNLIKHSREYLALFRSINICKIREFWPKYWKMKKCFRILEVHQIFRSLRVESKQFIRSLIRLKLSIVNTINIRGSTPAGLIFKCWWIRLTLLHLWLQIYCPSMRAGRKNVYNTFYKLYKLL